MKAIKYVADFETTPDLEDCRVWAYAYCEIGRVENIHTGNNLDDFMRFALGGSKTIYFHNLEFDGEFLLVWLFEHQFKFVKSRKDLDEQTFTTLISDRGDFYTLEISTKKRRIKILDSAKAIPLKVKEISKAFGLPIQKLTIDYHKPRPVGYELTPEEIEYIKHDVIIVAMALQALFDKGLTCMTQAANALKSYKETISAKRFTQWFPTPKYDSDIRQSYSGGFVYLNPRFQSKDLGKGITLDANSLYAAVMHDQLMPFGEGIYYEGEYQPDDIYALYVQLIKCQFELKPNHLPTIRPHKGLFGMPSEFMQSSDGEDVALYMTNPDLDLFLNHYNVYNLQYLYGWKFMAAKGMFDEYIEYWMKTKVAAQEQNNPGMRTIAKRMLVSLGGKFAQSPNLSARYPAYSNRRIRYVPAPAQPRKPLYIPVATFMNAWARAYTITAAQANYGRFIYADTDSLHLVGLERPVEVEIHPTKLGAWKVEDTFERARYLKPKTYIKETDGNLHITCAGMPDTCHQYVTWDNFREGTSYPGRLMPVHTKGGIVLVDSPFTILQG